MSPTLPSPAVPPVECSRCGASSEAPGTQMIHLSSLLLAADRPGYARPDVPWLVEGDLIATPDPAISAWLCQRCVEHVALVVRPQHAPPWPAPSRVALVAGALADAASRADVELDDEMGSRQGTAERLLRAVQAAVRALVADDDSGAAEPVAGDTGADAGSVRAVLAAGVAGAGLSGVGLVSAWSAGVPVPWPVVVAAVVALVVTVTLVCRPGGPR